MNHVFLIIQYFSKGTLKEFISFGFFQRKSILLSYFYKLLSALLHSHQNGVTHRDIKITNVFVDDLGNPILADFGCCQIFQDEIPLTVTKIGTLSYQSPEFFQDIPYDSRKADIWSMGVTFYIMAFRKNHFFHIRWTH